MIRRWSTALLPAEKRAAFWRAAVCEAILSMAPRLDDRRRFDATLTSRLLRGMRFHEISADAHGMQRTSAQMASPDTPSVLFNLQLRGMTIVSQRGRQYVQRIGRLSCIDSTEPYSLEFPESTHIVSLQVPLHFLPDSASALASATATEVDIANPVAGMLSASMRAFSCSVDTMSDAQVGACSQALLDLARAMWPTKEDRPVRQTGSLVLRARALMEERLGDPALTPGQLAQQLGVACRTLHAAFSATDSSVMAELMRIRLEHARRLLSSGGGKHLAVEQLARQCGFRSPSHFSRRFSAVFGTPPSRWRQHEES